MSASGELLFNNDGGEILSTNYFGSFLDENGLYFLSTNAGVFRLLTPKSREGDLKEMRTARYAVLTRGWWPEEGGVEGVEVMFEDETDAPFALQLGTTSLDRLPENSDQGREFKLSVWTGGGGVKKVAEFPAYYRRMPTIPCLMRYNPPK